MVVSDLVVNYRYNEAVSRARRAGLFTEAADFRKGAPADSENAAVEFRSAIASAIAIPAPNSFNITMYISHRNADLSYLKSRSDLPTSSQVRASVRAYAPAIRHLEAGLQKTRLDWAREWEQGPNLLLPEYSDLTRIAKALAADADFAALDGDFERALKRLTQIQNLAGLVEQEPTLVAFLVGLSLRDIANRTAMGLAINHPKLTHDLRAFFAGRDHADLRIALKGELHFALTGVELTAKQPEWLNDMCGTYSDGPGFWDDRNLLKLRSVKNSIKIRALELMATAGEKMNRAPHDWEVAEAALKTVDVNLGTQDDLASHFLNQFMPVLQDSGSAAGKLEARRRVGLVLTKLVDDRVQGQWPAKLPDLGADSLDPFSGKPLIYQKTKGGLLLYSVGADRVDNGGDRYKDVVIKLVDGRLVL